MFCPWFRSHRSFTPLLAFVLSVFLINALHDDALTQALPPLFTASSTTPTNPPTDAAIVRSRYVTLNFELLGDTDHPAPALQLNLFEDATFTALLDYAASNPPGSYTWVGVLDGIEHGQAVLVVTNDLLAGSISAPGANYEVRPLGGEVHAILEIDQSLFPPELEPSVVVTPPQNNQITEGDVGVTYTLALATQPVQPVTVNIEADQQGHAEPASLTFNTANWGMAQTVSVQAIDDALDEREGDHRSVITHTVVSDDEQYQNLSVDSVVLTIIDNDISETMIHLPLIRSP